MLYISAARIIHRVYVADRFFKRCVFEPVVFYIQSPPVRCSLKKITAGVGNFAGFLIGIGVAHAAALCAVIERHDIALVSAAAAVIVASAYSQTAAYVFDINFLMRIFFGKSFVEVGTFAVDRSIGQQTAVTSVMPCKLGLIYRLPVMLMCGLWFGRCCCGCSCGFWRIMLVFLRIAYVVVAEVLEDVTAFFDEVTDFSFSETVAAVVVCLVVVDVTLLEETVVTSVSETVVVAAVSLEASELSLLLHDTKESAIHKVIKMLNNLFFIFFPPICIFVLYIIVYRPIEFSGYKVKVAPDTLSFLFNFVRNYLRHYERALFIL